VTTLSNRGRAVLLAVQQTSRQEVLEIYLSTLAQVYDPHSDYLGHGQLDEFAISMNLSLFGIGAKLQSEWEKASGLPFGVPNGGLYKYRERMPEALAKEEREYLWQFDERGSFNAVCG